MPPFSLPAFQCDSVGSVGGVLQSLRLTAWGWGPGSVGDGPRALARLLSSAAAQAVFQPRKTPFSPLYDLL